MKRTKEFFNFGKPFEQRVQFTEAIRAGNFVFVSGMSAIDDEGRVIAPGDPEAQGRAVFETLEVALELAGAKLSDVVMETEFVTDMALYKPIARIRREYFPDHYPTATLVEVKGLWKPGLVFEMNAIAVLGTGGAGARGGRQSQKRASK